MKYSKILLSMFILMMSLSLSACNKAEDTTKDIYSQPTEAGATSVTEVAVAYPLTITDSMGRSITFESEPQSVVSIAPNITEMIYALGLENRLIGRTELCDFPEAVLSIDTIGTLMEPNIEKIVSLKPEVVIASTHFSEESEKQLSDLGIKVVILYEEHQMDGIYTMIETMGSIFNVSDQANQVVNHMKTSIEETATKVEGLEAPSVYIVIGYGEYGDYTAGGDTFMHQLISLAGGKNIASEVQGWSYSLESLIEADPSIILINEDLKEDFILSENYQDLSAVKENRVFGINTDLLDRQGIRNAEGIRLLAEIFHPESF
ncbi:MAG: ABC transporter substrate-binding protein [Vallitaleaceae bacterium]|nr:ABC transporter substrate-binding protein [Vallitaleaceae bacterium]